jgi:hypothetical protein
MRYFSASHIGGVSKVNGIEVGGDDKYIIHEHPNKRRTSNFIFSYCFFLFLLLFKK